MCFHLKRPDHHPVTLTHHLVTLTHHLVTLNHHLVTLDAAARAAASFQKYPSGQCVADAQTWSKRCSDLIRTSVHHEYRMELEHFLQK